MKAVRMAGTGVLVAVAGYFLVAAVGLWVSYSWNQAQGGSSYVGQSAFDASVAALLPAVVAVAAVRARRGGWTNVLVIAAATALPLSLVAIVWAALAGMGF